MPNRTIAIGDVHGGYAELRVLLSRLPPLTAADSLVFVGDYLDRGPDSALVVDYLRQQLPKRTPAKLVFLRGNHEDAWLRVVDGGWPEFLAPPTNGCWATYLSFSGVKAEDLGPADFEAFTTGTFFPPEVVAWMQAMPFWYEDENAIYVHAGLMDRNGAFLHPSEVDDPRPLLWLRTEAFFRSYRGKRVVFGHTVVAALPQQLSIYSPEDPTDLFRAQDLVGIDTRCGHGGFLSAIELPSLTVYESRAVLAP
jgi:serine/threonine protein phosphatase 1